VPFPRIGLVRSGSKALATAVALLLAIGLAACGGNGNDETSSTPATSEPTQRPSSTASDGQQSGGGGEGKPARGGEASIEDFGAEASGGDRDSIEGAFSAYLNAIAAKDYGTACSYLSASVQGSLMQFAPKELRSKGCVAILPKLLAPTAAAIAREQADGQITRVRVEGDRGFVVFKAPRAKLYQLTMVKEGGEWKSATVAAAVLVPEL
jgi:hypothetical protein